MTWSTALPDWEQRLFTGQSLIPPGMPFFPAEAQEAIDTFLNLKLIDVVGRPPDPMLS